MNYRNLTFSLCLDKTASTLCTLCSPSVLFNEHTILTPLFYCVFDTLVNEML